MGVWSFKLLISWVSAVFFIQHEIHFMGVGGGCVVAKKYGNWYYIRTGNNQSIAEGIYFQNNKEHVTNGKILIINWKNVEVSTRWRKVHTEEISELIQDVRILESTSSDKCVVIEINQKAGDMEKIKCNNHEIQKVDSFKFFGINLYRTGI
jgi:hypothetical protein